MKLSDDEVMLLVDALERIACMTDLDDPNSYAADDREGCLDTVHAVAKQAASKAREAMGAAQDEKGRTT